VGKQQVDCSIFPPSHCVASLIGLCLMQGSSSYQHSIISTTAVAKPLGSSCHLSSTAIS
jgi:hypothetical protein